MSAQLARVCLFSTHEFRERRGKVLCQNLQLVYAIPTEYHKTN